MKKLVCSVLFAATAAGSASAETVFWYRFDEKDVGTTLAVDDTLADEMGGDGAVVKKTKNSPQAPKIAEGVPFKVYDPLSKTSYTSTGSVRVIPAGYGAQYYIDVPYRKGMNGKAFTVEGFFRQDPKSMREIGGMWGGKWSRCFFTQGDLWRFGVDAADFWVFDGCSVMGTSVTVSNTTVPGAKAYRMDDGLWHHVAVVYDGTDPANRTFRVYLDKQIVAEQVGCAEIAAAEGTDPASIRVGSANSSGAAAFHGWIDEVRYTDAALTPAQFLEPVDEFKDKDTLGWWRFEDDSLGTLLYRNESELGEDGLAILTESNGKTVSVRSGMNLDVKVAASDKRTSRQVCTVNSGYLVAPDSPLFLKGGFTAEMFIKFDETLNGAEYLYGPGAYPTFFTKAKASAKRDDDKGLYVYLNNTGPSGTTSNYGRWLTVTMCGETKVSSLSTEKPWTFGWHHLSMTYDPVALTFVLYNDYKEILRWENCPKLPDFDPEVQRPFAVMRSNDVNQNPNYVLDELRVTRGVLLPAEFLDLDFKTDALKKGDTLAFWTFDGDYKAMNCHACIEGWPAVNAGGASGAYLTNEVRGGRTYIKDGAAGRVLHVNQGSAVTSNRFVRLGFAKGVSRDSLPPTAMTFEFFTRSKCTPNTYKQIVSFKKSLIDWEAYQWSINQTGTAGNLTVDALASSDQVKPDYPCMNDDVWHHIALSMRLTGNVDEENRKETEFKFYYDRKLAKTWTQFDFANFFTWNTLIGRVHIGGMAKSNHTEDTKSIGYVGNIDELRVSYGALEPEDFLRQSNGHGLMLLLK